MFKPGSNYGYVFLLLFVAIISCTSHKKETIMCAGSSTVLPVVSRAAGQFRLRHPNVNIVVNAGGSGVGINLLGEQKINIGMMSRNITQKEIERYPNVYFITHPVGKDAVVPVVSSEVYNEGGVKALMISQIAGIYEGEIKNWGELGGPDRGILVVDKEKSRGTRHVFMEKVLGNREAEAPGADLVLGSNNEEQTAIAQSDAAIGMLSNAWINDDVKGLSIITGGETIEPTRENIKNGKFSITRELLLITNGAPQGIIREFIDFIKSPDGQEIVEQAGYVSLYE